MSEVTVLVCKTTSNRDEAKSFLAERGYTKVTVEETTKITYDAEEFNDPASRTDIVKAKRFVVIGVKP
jgi:uncharacterized protein YfdQ (DUF2303 family)